ncbi:MAG TPA: sugar ABC transporter permease [Caldilineaceae bacterium]|nr:sugar ABC transporter permease [Caldilineaceae bacterium]
MSTRERWIPYLFLAPAVALLLTFNLFPTIATLNESLHANSLVSGGRIFVGLENFQRIFNDPVFWKSLQVTVIFSLLVNPIQVTLALALAVLANQKVRGIALFRSIYLLPVAVSINVTTIVWGLMLDSNSGIVNGVLALLGIPAQPFLTAPSHALWSIIILATWKGVPLWALFFLAGLQGIPEAVIEAAKIDGATRWQLFTRVTFPLLRGVLIFVLVADTVANFLLFAPILLLTQGGPQLSTNLIMYETYRRGFVYGDLGASAAMLWVMLIIVFVVIGFEFFLLRERA